MTEPTALAVRRIALDCHRVTDLESAGLFWVGDDSNVTKGYAIVLGPEGSPYHGGAFCFEVTFPYNYPYSPPVFNYLTNDGKTRFNPNLYKNGKVCLSLLNTWAGEPWSGVQSLSSILQSLQTAVLNADPLCNEPAYSTAAVHRDVPVYNRMIFHSTIETAILGYLKNPPEYLAPFYAQFKAAVMTARPAILAKLADHAAFDDKTEEINFYHMAQKYRFARLAEELKQVL